MPYYPDTSVLGPGALTGALSGATVLSFSGPAVSQSVDPVTAIGTVFSSGGANVQNAGTQVGFAQYLNFAGTAMGGLSIANNTATITVNGVAGGGTVVVLQTGTVVGNETGINFTGLTATFGNTASTATIPLDVGFGLDRSVQFNNAGHQSGSNLLDIDASGNLTIAATVSGVAPLIPAAGNLTIFNRLKAGRNLLSYISPSGLDGPYQPMLGMNKIVLVQGSGTTMNWLGVTGTQSGAYAAPAPATTNFSSSLRRTDIQNTTPAAGQGAGLAISRTDWWLGNVAGAGGFFSVFRVIFPSTGTIAQHRYFVGWSTGTNASATFQDPGVQLNSFGVGKNATGTTYNFFHCDATLANNRQIDTGITHNVGDVCEVRIFAKPSATQVNMSLEVISVGGSGAVGGGPYAEYATTGNLVAIPTNTTLLAPRIWTQTTGTSSGKIGFISMYVETDW